MDIELTRFSNILGRNRSKKAINSFRALAVAALLQSCMLGEPGSGNIPESSEAVKSDESDLQSDEDALYQDVEILAKEVGATPRDVLHAIEFQHRFAQLSDKLRTLFPDLVAGIWMASVPDRVGYVRFVGEAPERAIQLIRNFELSSENPSLGLRANQSGEAQINVLVDGNTPWHVQRLRTRGIIEFLKQEKDVEAAITWYDVERNKIVVELSFDEARRVSDSSWLVRELNGFLQQYSDSQPEAIRSFYEFLPLTVAEIDVSEMREEDRLNFYAGIGGLSMGSSNSLACTSGWASKKIGVGTGVTTAGHCENVTELWHPGGKEDRLQVKLHSWTRNFDGDIAFYTTSGRDKPVFYANDIVKRRVKSKVRDENMIGRRVCTYGRMTRKRTCNHRVVALNQSYFVRLGEKRFLEVGFLAKVTNDGSRKGDSGGGVSFSTSAYGTIVGGTGKNLYFYTIDEAERELGIETLLDNG